MEVLVERPGRMRVPRRRRKPAAVEPFVERWRREADERIERCVSPSVASGNLHQSVQMNAGTAPLIHFRVNEYGSAANADRGRRKMCTNASAVRHDAKDIAQKAKVSCSDVVAARCGSPKGDHDVVSPVRDVQDRSKERALTSCRGAAKDLRAKIFAVMRRLTPERQGPRRDERPRVSKEARGS